MNISIEAQTAHALLASGTTSSLAQTYRLLTTRHIVLEHGPLSAAAVTAHYRNPDLPIIEAQPQGQELELPQIDARDGAKPWSTSFIFNPQFLELNGTNLTLTVSLNSISLMDLFNKLASQHGQQSQQHPAQAPQQTSGGGGFMGFLNNAAGGGQAGEAKEDGLDKAVDWAQQHILGQGDQSNESAIEQAKDEQISDFIRSQYKGATGKDFPVADK